MRVVVLKRDFLKQFADVDLTNEWFQRFGTVEKDDMVAILQKVSAKREREGLCRKLFNSRVIRSDTYSADEAPLVPAEKLSTKRTVLCSRGTVVPPDFGQKEKNENWFQF